MLPSITPPDAARLVREEGAMLADVREPHEFAATRIPGARNLPLSRLAGMDLGDGEAPVVFMCLSGMRTRSAASLLRAKAGARRAWVMQGGLNAWEQAGLPIEAAPAGGGSAGAPPLSPWLLVLVGTAVLGLGLLMLRAFGA